jgi:hypothetical protein
VSKPTLPSLEKGGLKQDFSKPIFEEIKKVEVAPKINIPEMKAVEIKTPTGSQTSDISSQMSDVRSQNEIKPEIKNESVLFKKPEVVVIQNDNQNPSFDRKESSKIEPDKPAEIKTNISFRPTDIKIEEVRNDVKKPIFIKTEEEHIPQPPQLNRNPQPVFESNPSKSPLDKGDLKKPEDPNKMDYDKLFGDGIV